MKLHGEKVPKLAAPCLATAQGQSYGFDLEQGMQATTIAAVGKRMNMPNHAITVAIATALQESKMHNINYGDRDSVGLFQQRPSQGWGTKTQLLTPTYSAQQFYVHLARVKNWEKMSVTDAAQAVQHSAAPNAYAQWESQSRVLAQALTGEVPAGFTCQIRNVDATNPGEVLQTITNEMGSPGPNVTVNSARGWLISSWLIGHAPQYGIVSVTFAGQRWSAKTGKWSPAKRADDVVTFNP